MFRPLRLSLLPMLWSIWRGTLLGASLARLLLLLPLLLLARWLATGRRRRRALALLLRCTRIALTLTPFNGLPILF